jgi:hypothetical protein
LFGKEFLLNPNQARAGKKQRIIFIDVKTNYVGGKRYIPLNQEESVKQGKAVYSYDQSYAKKYKDFSKTDLKIGYKVNGKKVTQEYQLDITNIFNRKNILFENYNRKAGKVEYVYQLGFMIMPQIRITF